MNDKQFEHIIKNKLSGFKPDLTPDWELFLEKKTIAADAIVTPFDEQLKDKLETYQSDATPNWEAFVAHRIIADTADEAEAADFDDQVKANLENYQTSAVPRWESFTTYRDANADTAADDNFDTEIRNNLEEYQSEDQPQWAAFLDYKLEAEAHSADAFFDDRLRSELEEYQDLSQPQWDAFQAFKTKAVDTDEEVTAIDNSFDKQVRAGVAGYVLANAVPQWDAFQAYKAKANTNQEETELDNSFDRQVRAGVTGYVLANAIPQWDAFKAYKEKADTSGEAGGVDGDFDKQVRAGVAGYVLANAVPQWEAFKKHQEANVDLQNVDFDNQLVSAFEDYKSDTDPQWEKFLDKKRKSDAVYADAGFDSSLGQRLSNMKVRYNSEHWLLLKARLESIAKLRKQIFSYKTLEMIFVSLMLFTFGNHLHLLLSGNNQPIVETEIVKVEAVVSSETSSELNKAITAPAATVQEKTIETIASKVARTTSDNSERQSSATNRVEDKIKAPVLTSSGGSDDGLSNAPISNSGQAVQASLPLATVQQESPATLNNEGLGLAVDRSLMKTLDAIHTGQLSEVRMTGERTLRQPADAKYVDLSIKKTYRDEGSWIHLYNAMTNNYVSTPFNTDLGLEGLTHQMYGYAAELLVSKQKGRWELESGLGYSMVNYTPYDSGRIRYSTPTGFRTIDFEKINIDFASIPVKLKYHFIANGRWSIYTGLGINNDFIARTTYDIVDEEGGGGPMGPDPLPSDLPPFYDREFTTGLFGKTPDVPTFVDYKTKSNNYLLRGNISLGAERNVSDNFAAYLRVTYDKTLYNTEIGPYNDELNKVSFGMGFKMRLK